MEMALQSDISSFFDQITLSEDAEFDHVPSSPSMADNHQQAFQSADMYNLLLKRDNNKDQYRIPNEKLYLLQNRYNQSSSTAPLSTINPRKLSAVFPSTSSSSSNSSSTHIPSSDIDSIQVNGDSNSVSSVEDFEEQTLKQHPTRMNNWSMNDEFKNAIQEWLSQNEIRAKRNSISENSRPNFRRTSISKRRKSESSVAFHNNSSTINNIRNLKQSTKSPPISSTTLPSSENNSKSKSKSSTPTVSQSAIFSSPKSTSSVEPNFADPSNGFDPNEEKPFKCEDCPKAFRRSEHLKRHIRSVHSNIRPFPCKYCEKKFSRSDNLAQHLRTHNRH